jgi:RNA polymerase sigma-70 factor (sigma-E family)
VRATSPPDAAGLQTSETGLSVDVLFAAHYERLVRVAWLLVRDDGRAEELVQDAFVDLVERRPRLLTVSDAGGYLYVSVLNRSRSALRRVRTTRAVLERLGNEPHPGPETSAEASALRAFERQRVLDALATLPRRQREVLVLRHYAQLSEAETAETLGVSRGSVKSHGARGLRALRPLLEGVDDERRA